jgi:phage replication-related protein YjqB (UPF0714/DUF867 family)
MMVNAKVISTRSEFDHGIPGPSIPQDPQERCVISRERCALSADLFQRLWPRSRPLDHDFTRPGNRPQIRMTARGNPARSALFTVVKIAAGDGRVALGPCALDRWAGTVAAGVASPRAVTLAAAILDPVRFTEQLIAEADADLVVIAPHGDDIEACTHLQPDEVARILRLGGRSVTTWTCLGQGFDNVGARIRWHITSTDISERSFPGLRTIMGRRFARALAFHGHDRPDLPDVAIGGRGSAALRAALEQSIRNRLVGTDLTVGPFPAGSTVGGTHLHNIINRLGSADCVHIEQSPQARATYWQVISEAVSEVL